jgi:hypothetical protein
MEWVMGLPMCLTDGRVTGPIQTMDDDQASPANRPPHRSVTEIRRAREAEALRENLRRRKDQQRARATPEPEPELPSGKDTG